MITTATTIIIANIIRIDRIRSGYLKHMRELSFRDAVPVHDDPVRLVAARALVEHHQVLFDLGRFQLLYCAPEFKRGNLYFLKMTLTIADKSWMISCLCC